MFNRPFHDPFFDDPDPPAEGWIPPDYSDYQNFCDLNAHVLWAHLQMVLHHLRSAGSLQFFGVTVDLHLQSTDEYRLPLHWSTLQRFDEKVLTKNKHFSLNSRALVEALSELQLTEFVYLSQRIHSGGGPRGGQPHYQLFVAVRSLYGTDQEQIQASIEQKLFYCCYEYRVQRLHSFEEQSRFLEQVMEGNNRSRQMVINFSEAYPLPDGSSYLGPLLNHLWHVRLPLAGCGSYLRFRTGFEPRRSAALDGVCAADGQLQSVYLRHRLVRPPATRSVGLDTLVYLFVLGCQLQGWQLYAGSLYRKRPVSHFSHELVGTLSELLQSGVDWLGPLLLKEFPSQTVGLQSVLYGAFVNHRAALNDHLLGNGPKLLPPLQLNHQLVEFSNGIYNKGNNRFLRWRRNSDLLKRDWALHCYLHFNIPFRPGEDLMVPTGWLGLLGPHFGGEGELEEFCGRFGSLFQGVFIQRQLREVAVEGAPSGGLPAFGRAWPLVDGIRRLVGFWRASSPPEEAHRRVGVWHLLLRFLDGEPLPTEEEQRARQIVSLLEPVLLLLNTEQQQAMLPEDLLRSRLRHYRFTAVLGSAAGEVVLDLVQKELPCILVHCNRLFLKIYGQRLPGPPVRWKHVADPLQARLVRYGCLPPPEPPAPEPPDFFLDFFYPLVAQTANRVWVDPNDHPSKTDGTTAVVGPSSVPEAEPASKIEGN